MKKELIVTLVSGLACLLFGASSQAQDRYPNRPIELVVANTPGGVTDRTTRIYSEQLGRVLKVPIVVVNRGGGGGIQGATYVMRAKKDGYTLLSGSSDLVYQPIISKEANYDPAKDLIPLGRFVSVPNVFCVRSDSPFQTLDELIEYGRKNPGKLKYGTSGIGGHDYFQVEILASKANMKMVPIPFKGGGEALISLLSGNVDCTFTALPTNAAQIKAGKLRGLAITSKTRDPEFPNIFTTAELGHPYPFIIPWFGIFSNAGLPQSILNVLIPAVEKVFKNPEVAQRAIKMGFTVEYLGPKEFRQLIETDYKTVDKLAEDVNLKKKIGSGTKDIGDR